MAKNNSPAPADRGELKTFELVYIGRMDNGYCWLNLPIGFRGDPSKDSDIGGAWIFKKPLVKTLAGSIWRIKGYEWDGNISLLTPKAGDNAPEYLGNWQNIKQRQAWLIEDDRANLRRRLNSKAAKKQAEELPLAALEPFNRAYWKATPGKQAEILALVIAQITLRPKP